MSQTEAPVIFLSSVKKEKHRKEFRTKAFELSDMRAIALCPNNIPEKEKLHVFSDTLSDPQSV